MALSDGESCGSWGQNGTSGENWATACIAEETELRGKLPIPVTAPAETNGFLTV